MLSDSDKLRSIDRKKRRALDKAGWYSDQQKLEAVQVWLLCGSMTQTSAATGININTIEKWRYTDWWKELADQIKAEGRVQLSGRLQKIVSRSLDLIEDRLENGDYVISPVTGELKRRPLLARDALRVSAEFIEKSRKIDSVTKEETTHQAVEDRLKALADAFSSFSKKVRRIEVEDTVPLLENSNETLPDADEEDEEADEAGEEVLDAVHEEREA